MGLLDDAIREHLDLKRRRGADPAEIERAEREALGPVRRKGGEAPGAAGSELDALIEGDEQETADDSYEPSEPYEEPRGYGESVAHEEPVDDAEPPVAPAEPGVAHAGDLAAHDELMRDDDEADDPPPLHFADERDEPFAEDEHATRVMRVPAEPPAGDDRGAPGAGDRTSEYDVEEYLAAEAEQQGADEDDEDVLEETPEFLQDTPDHDRLWFEQRPPRDFDFDG